MRRDHLARPATKAAQTSLFDAQPALRRGQRALERAASKNLPEIERLVPLVRELAELAREFGEFGSAGITVADVREEAVRRGLLTGQEAGRQLSYLGAVMRAADLVNTGQYRRSHLLKSNGNLQAIWRAPA